MINVRELMLGNFVKAKDGVVLVGKIHRDSVADKWGGIYFDDEIEGIEVTGELLEKMGFEKVHPFVKEDTLYQYWSKDALYKLEVDGVSINSGRKWHLHIDNDRCCHIGSGEFTYVHELMNLTRICTGCNLPITKEMLYD